MLVKRYVVKEMPEAVAMIRDDLGKDAVILSTKKVQSRGFLGLFAKTHIEVIAAANETEPKAERSPFSTASVARPTAMGAYQQSKSQTTASVTPPRTMESAFPSPASNAGAPTVRTAPALDVQQQKMANRTNAVQAESTAQPQVQAVIRQQNLTNPVVQDALLSTEVEVPAFKQRLEPPEPQSLASHEQPQAVPKTADDSLLKEVQELRSLLRTLVHSSSHQMLPESLIQIRRQLLENDVEEKWVDELMERGIRHFQQIQAIDQQEFRGILLNFIKEDLVKASEPMPLALQTRVASFMGPTGVGKTTTIAKLAAEQVLKFGKKVGMITTDTYRIAAVDQLRTYANILNVPLEVCYSPEDVNRAMDKFADRDLILVDTAGRNYYNDLNVRELSAYLQVLQPDETYLVLSLTTKSSDLKQIVQNFVQVTIDKFLFTKTDETKTFGPMYNLVQQHKIPLSYVTTGQNVPDDIEVASVEKIASFLVGERTDA